MTRASACLVMAALIAVTPLAGCGARAEPALSGERSALTLGFDGGSLRVERGECQGFDPEVPCDCDRIDHPGGFDLACRPIGP